MGTFAKLIRKPETKILEEKKEEFKNRVETLFQAGGMMELSFVEMYNKKVGTIRKASMHEDGMNFFYNYFEDDRWENAGFSIKNYSVWSNKIGWRQFYSVVVAAYVLESLYLDGSSYAEVDGFRVGFSDVYRGWINYLFHEQIAEQNPWEQFQITHDLEEEMQEYELEIYATLDNFKDLKNKNFYALTGYYEVKAVMSGLDSVIEEIDEICGREQHDSDKNSVFNFKNCIKELKPTIETFQKESRKSKEEQLRIIIEIFRSIYQNEKFDKFNNQELKALHIFIVVLDAPAIVIMAIAEIYEKDFWQLWDQVRDVAEKKFLIEMYNLMEEDYKQQDNYNEEKYKQFMKQKQFIPDPVRTISTMDFLNIKADDMILFWDADGKINFSNELKIWFNELVHRFNQILEGDILVNEPLKWILGLMEYANENYYRIYTFTDFFEETVEHLNDKRFLVVWKMYDEMLHDPVMEEAGSVIFVPDGPEYEHVGLGYLGKQPHRRLIKYWDIMEMEKKNNEARMTFRRYMALLANKKLRKEVFGF